MNAPVVYHVNANGVRPRLEELRAATAGVAVVSIQETRLRRSSSSALQETWPDYRVFSWPHNENGPGSALLVRASLASRLLLRRSQDRHRLLAVEVQLPDGTTLVVASLYAPPRTNAAGATLRRDFLEAALGSRRAVLVGDLNARARELGCRSSNTNGAALAGYVEESGAVILNDPSVPTFHHSSSDFLDCLDWAIATPAASALFTCSVGEDVGSDHLPLLLHRPPTTVPPSSASDVLPRWRTSGRGWTEAFSERLHRELLNRRLTSRAVPTSTRDVDDMAAAIEEAVSTSADACLRRSRQRPDSSALPLPWWLRLLVRERKRVRRRRGRDPEEDPDLRRQLSVLRAQIRRGVVEARRQRLLAKTAVFARGPKEPLFWPEVRRWFRGHCPQLPPLQPPIQEAPPARTPAERANVFAQHLAQAFDVPRHRDFDAAFFRQVEDDIGADPLFRPAAYDSTETDPEEPTAAVSPYAVARALRQLHGGKTPGPDGISTDLLKAAPFGLAVALATLFTGSLRIGFVPARWRLAWVRMLPKPGRTLTSAAHFRPVALTSCVGKVLERLFARRLETWCDCRGLLPPEQSGFRHARDALEQTVLLAQRAVQACNGGLVTAVASLDVSKAYDSVWHAGLLLQCREVLPDSTCRWIAGFLQARTAAVLESGTLSTPFPAPGGVPQGSPLSPLLYVIYTRTLPLPRGQRLGSTAYADDVALWASDRSPAAAWQRLVPFLNDLLRWGRRWRLRFSPEKTQAAFFSRRLGGWTQEQLGAPSFDGTPLEWHPHLDLLGVRLDRRLRLLRHARHVAQRVAPRVLELRRLRHSQRGVPAWVGLLLYRSLIRPSLTYAAPLLPLACDSAWERLEQMERSGLRAALRVRRDYPTEDLRQRTRALRPFRSEVRRLGYRFLARHVRSGNLHLLAAFRTEVDQHADRLHQDGPLELLFAWLQPLDRPALAARIRARVEPPPPQHPGRPSRARYSALASGLNPFDLTVGFRDGTDPDTL